MYVCMCVVYLRKYQFICVRVAEILLMDKHGVFCCFDSFLLINCSEQPKVVLLRKKKRMLRKVKMKMKMLRKNQRQRK